MKSLLTLWFFIASCCSCFSQGLEDWAEPNNRFFLQVEAFEIDTNTLTELTFDQKLSKKALYKNVQQLVKEKKAKLKSSTGEYLQLDEKQLFDSAHLMVHPTEWDLSEEHPEISLINGTKIADRHIIPSMPVNFENRPVGTSNEFTLTKISPTDEDYSIEEELSSPSYRLEVEIQNNQHVGYSQHTNTPSPIATPLFSVLKVKTELRITLDRPYILSINTPRDKHGEPIPHLRVIHFIKLHQLAELKKSDTSPSSNLSVEFEWVQLPTNIFNQLSKENLINSHRLRHQIQPLILNKKATLLDSSLNSNPATTMPTASRKRSSFQHIIPTEYEPDKFDRSNQPSWEDQLKLMEARGYWSYPITYYQLHFEEWDLGLTSEVETSIKNGIVHINVDLAHTSLTQTDTISKVSYKEGSADITFPRIYEGILRNKISLQENQYQLLNYSHPVLPDGTVDPTQTIAIFARAIITPTQ